MITLLTGSPGTGKTSLVLHWLLTNRLYQGRPIIAVGLPLTDKGRKRLAGRITLLEPDEFHAQGWKSAKKNTLFFLDEAYRFFPGEIRGGSAHQQGIATHRHLGLDFLLATQHPTQLNNGLLVLVGRHIHLARVARRVRAWEWVGRANRWPENAGKDKTAIRFSYPGAAVRRVFPLYVSSELHTRQPGWPIRVWITILFLVAGLPAILFFSLYQVIRDPVGNLGAVAPAAAGPRASWSGICWSVVRQSDGRCWGATCQNPVCQAKVLQARNRRHNDIRRPAPPSYLHLESR